MQRLNRSTSSPKGAAFILFLGLAIVPFSLRAAGLQVSFSPSLSAATDAWRQITDVFGSGYQPVLQFALSTPEEPGGNQSPALDAAACSGRELACGRDDCALSAATEIVWQVSPLKAPTARRACPKMASCARASCRVTEPAIAATVARDMLQTQVLAFEKLSALELATHAQRRKSEELVKNIEMQIAERSFAIPQNLPQNLRMLVRLKAPPIPSATKAAECKVRVALDSARRVKRERAALTGAPSLSPDNSEL